MSSRTIALASAGTFLVVFLISLTLTAPMDVVARIAEARIESALDHRYRVELGSIRLRGLSGATLRDVSIVSNAPHVEGAPRSIPLRIDMLRANVSLLSLMRSTPDVRAELVFAEGRVDIQYRGGEGAGHTLVAAIEELELRQLHPLREQIGLPVQGRLDGTFRIVYDEEGMLQEGEIALRAGQATIGPGEIRAEAFEPFGGAIPLPVTRLGTIELEGDVDGPRINVTRFEGRGEDLRFDVGGNLVLRSPFARSQLRMTLTFGLNETYVEEAGLAAALGMWPVLREAQTGDQYALLLSGPIGNLPPPQPLRRTPRD